MTGKIRESSLMPFESVREIASEFNLPGQIEAFDFPEKGNINQQTYLIVAGPAGNQTEYLLQRLNSDVFTNPRAVMEAMVQCIEFQKKAISEGIGAGWETIQLIPTLNGQAYLEKSQNKTAEFWRMMVRIPHARSYKSLSEISDSSTRLKIAEETGKGLALFGLLTDGMNIATLKPPLPGYRDTQLYYDQLDSVLAGSRTLEEAAPYLPSEAAVRKSTEQHFIVHLQPDQHGRRLEDSQIKRRVKLALDQKVFGLQLLQGIKRGDLRKVAIHGDTKLDNFLFSTLTGKVKALVDLDTIMPHTWLADWGDTVRSLVNVSGEKNTEADRIRIDFDIYRALARGFLGTARNITSKEIELMADSAPIMALELGVRFLADYLRGDSYFKLTPEDPEDLNKIRALVQFSVFENLRRNTESAKHIIEDFLP
jgi:hypothetical protein